MRENWTFIRDGVVRGVPIVNIEVIEHKTAYMAQAKQIAEAVCDEQSLKVDAISGAALTSNTVLKAIENALGKTESFE